MCGTYIRHWCPELARLPDEHIHVPFLAPPAPVLRDAGVALGETYPHPVVDHALARQAALEGYELIRKRRAG
jgi:deoxyribodipyrimidine photo-lyase